MRGGGRTVRLALVIAALLGSLSLVVWRQSRALETLRLVERVHRERAVVEAERTRLARRISELESRSRVARLARERLSMRLPTSEELVILPLEPLPEPAESPAPRWARAARTAARPGGGDP